MNLDIAKRREQWWQSAWEFWTNEFIQSPDDDATAMRKHCNRKWADARDVLNAIKRGCPVKQEIEPIEPNSRKLVAAFWPHQPTKSFPEGAPDRAEYNTDEDHLADCRIYAKEWREEYQCGSEPCRNGDCPQHYPEERQP